MLQQDRIMGKLWLNNELIDRLAMLQQTETGHPGMDIDLAISHSFFGIEKTSKNQRDKLRKMARKYIHEALSTQLDAQLKDMGFRQSPHRNLVTLSFMCGGHYKLYSSTCKDRD